MKLPPIRRRLSACLRTTSTTQARAQPLQFFGAPGPSNLNQWTYDYNDILTKTLGSQNIKVGGGTDPTVLPEQSRVCCAPRFQLQKPVGLCQRRSLSESGQFDHSTGVPFANRQDDRITMWGFFVQDDYKIRPNLTVNLGLRWSYFGALYSKENNLDVLQFGSGANALTDLNIRVGGNLYTPQKNNWGPQVGFAWQPKVSDGKAVVRGGFGINYNQNEIAILANGIGNPPNAVQANFTCPYPYTNNPTCAGNGILYETAGEFIPSSDTRPTRRRSRTLGPTTCRSTAEPIFVTGFPGQSKDDRQLSLLAGSGVSTPISNGGHDRLPWEARSRHLLTQSNFNVIALRRRHSL